MDVDIAEEIVKQGPLILHDPGGTGVLCELPRDDGGHCVEQCVLPPFTVKNKAKGHDAFEFPIVSLLHVDYDVGSI